MKLICYGIEADVSTAVIKVHTPEMEILQKLMEFDDRGRCISLNAIANQIRCPSSHTHYYSCVMLSFFIEAKDEGLKEQVIRVLLFSMFSGRKSSVFHHRDLMI